MYFNFDGLFRSKSEPSYESGYFKHHVETIKNAARKKEKGRMLLTVVQISAELHQFHKTESDYCCLGVIAITTTLNDACSNRHDVLKIEKKRKI